MFHLRKSVHVAMSVRVEDQLDKIVSDSATGDTAAAAELKKKSLTTGAGGDGENCISPRRKRDEWDIPISSFARLTINPIRCIVEGLKLEPNPDKSFIPLSLGKSRIKIYILSYVNRLSLISRSSAIRIFIFREALISLENFYHRSTRH